MVKINISFSIKGILLTSVFLVLFVIQYISLLGWTFLAIGISEGTFLTFYPSGRLGDILEFIINFLLTSIISGIAIFIYIKTQNKNIFWIAYTIFTIALFIITSYAFRGFVI